MKEILRNILISITSLLVLQATLIPREIDFSLISAFKLWKEIKKEKAENEISEIKNRSSMRGSAVPGNDRKKERKKKQTWVGEFLIITYSNV